MSNFGRDCAIVARPIGAGCGAAGVVAVGGDGEGARPSAALETASPVLGGYVATLGRGAGAVLYGPPDELIYEAENDETKEEVANEVHDWLRECD